MRFKLVVVGLLALLLLVFSIQNYQVVELRFLLWTLETSRAILIVCVFVSGVAVGSIISSVR